MLKIRTETEDWREIVNGWVLDAEDERPDFEVDQLADELCCDVLRLLNDAGVEYERAYHQSVGAFAIVQAGDEAEREAFDTAIEAATADLKKSIARRKRSD